MQRPPVVAVRNIAPNNNTQITNAQFIKPNQQPILRAQNAAFPLTLNANSAINSQFMVAKNDQGQMFLVPPPGQSPLVQLQTQTLQTQQQNALQTSTQQSSVGQVIKPMGGQVIMMTTNITTPTTTRHILLQTQQEHQVQQQLTSARLPHPTNQRLLPSSTPSQQQVKAPSLVVLQQQDAKPTQIQTSTPVVVTQTSTLPNIIQGKEVMANVKKCKNFLSTLLKLAANHPPKTNKNVYDLIQGLIDGQVTPEQFTAQLQKELKSSPQPNLIPFLKESLPYLRHYMLMNKMQIDGIRPPSTSTTGTPQTPTTVISSSAMNPPRPDSASPLVDQIQTSALSDSSTLTSQSIRTLKQESPQSNQSSLLTKQVAANLLNSLVAATAADVKQIPPQVLVASQQFLRTGIRPNQIQVQVQQHLQQQQQQSMNRLQLHQLVQQPTAQHLATAMGATGYVAQNQQQSNLPRFIISQNSLLNNQQLGVNGSILPLNTSTPSFAAQNNLVGSSSAATHKGEKRKYDAMRDDDDIMDVAAMGGVNLNEETKNILAHTTQLSSSQMRSCKEEMFLNIQSLANRIQRICQLKGLTFTPDVLNIISHAAKERHASLIAQLDTVTSHRLQIYKNDDSMIIKNEVRRQLKFKQDLARIEGERAKERESKAIIKAAKSRTKSDDPEQLKKKELARKQQQQEMEDKVKEQSNLTALAAIGPRRQKTSGLLSTTQGHAGVSSGAGLLSASQSLSLRARVKRATLKDMLHVMESDRHLRNTPLYYKVSYGLIP